MAESRRPSEQRRTVRIEVDFPAKIIAGKKKIDCKAREFQYLGEGTTEQQAREGHAADSRKNRLTEGSISFYVAAYACPGWKME